MTRQIALLIIVALTSACASQPKHVAMTRIPDEAKVLLDVQSADAKLPDASSDAGTYAANVGGGALLGAGYGAFTGFGLGLACGPAIVICGPVFAVGGAMGGAVVGIGVGTFSAASLQLPEEKSQALDEIIAQSLEELDMVDEVSTSFRTSGSSRWNFVDEGAEVEIQIILEGIGLEKHEKDQVTISMATSLTVRTGTGEGARIERRTFETTSLLQHIDYWIDEDGVNFREELQLQASWHARDMFNELRSWARHPVQSSAVTAP